MYQCKPNQFIVLLIVTMVIFVGMQDAEAMNCGNNICKYDEVCLTSGDCACVNDEGNLVKCLPGEICHSHHGCRDITSDPEYCGADFRSCGQGETCEYGICHCGSRPAAHDFTTACWDGVETCFGWPPRCGPKKEGKCGTVVCGQNQSCCDRHAGYCANLKESTEHCGACNRKCPAGNVCVNGVCKLTCQTGSVNCNGVCVELRLSNQHCGACGNVCNPGEICDGRGSCELTCRVGQVKCGHYCVDLRVSNQHCGACGNVCNPGEICDGTGNCALTCKAGQVLCGTACVDLKQSNQHCGVCGNACGEGTVCYGGRCGKTIQPKERWNQMTSPPIPRLPNKPR